MHLVLLALWCMSCLLSAKTFTRAFSSTTRIHSSGQMTSHALFRKIPEAKLGVSEPNPMWFGNPGNERNNPHWTNANWLKSRFHFSFAEYSNHRNQNFGVLRVMNDDLVQPDRGFGGHPHRDVEICTYVVEGRLTHQDSMGTSETLGRGSIQFMTAGTGVQHSEHNLDKKDPLRFIQIWINTRQRGLRPNYGSHVGQPTERENTWAHLVSDVKGSFSTPIKINQEANIHVTEVSAGKSVSFSLAAGRQAYLLCIEGSARIDGAHGSETLTRHDAAEVFGENTFSVTPTAGADKAHMLLVEMAYTGIGRSDL